MSKTEERRADHTDKHGQFDLCEPERHQCAEKTYVIVGNLADNGGFEIIKVLLAMVLRFKKIM